MKILSKLILSLSILLFSHNLNAQFFKKAKDKFLQKAEQKANEKIDNTTNTVLEAPDKQEKNKKLNIDKEASIYKFNQSLILELKTDGGETAELEFYFSKTNKELLCMTLDSNTSGDTSGQVYNVMTPESVTLYMDMPGMKIKKSSTAENFANFDNSEKMPSKEDLKKTGRTKTILGFLCSEYTYENDGGMVTAWVTTQNFPVKSKFLPLMGMSTNSPLDGFVMALNYSTSNEKGSIEIKKINKNKTLTINTSEYKSF